MTAQLVEYFAVQACCSIGGYGDGTPFDDISVDQIGDVLSKDCGFADMGMKCYIHGLTEGNVRFIFTGSYLLSKIETHGQR